MAVGRGFFDQYSVFCVFGSVVGCVVVPLITQVKYGNRRLCSITLSSIPSSQLESKTLIIVLPLLSLITSESPCFLKYALFFSCQSVESVIFSAIVISLTATHLTKRASKSENSTQVGCLNAVAKVIIRINPFSFWFILFYFPSSKEFFQMLIEFYCDRFLSLV